MVVTMELYELKNICMDMAELGVANYLKQTKPAKDLISQREAYRLFQSARVKRWVDKELIKGYRSGETTRSKILYSMSELMAIDKSERLNAIIHK